MAVWTDCISYKVKNSVIVAGIIIGIVFRILEYGIWGLAVWMLGAIIPILSLWLLFRYRMLGAGDIKLFSIVGGVYGPSIIINTMILAFLAGGVLSVIRLLQTGGFINRLQYLAGFISNQSRERTFTKYYQSERDGRAPVIHFTIAILIGFLGSRFGEITVWG